MGRLLTVLLFLTSCATTSAEEPHAPTLALETLDRTIRNEPEYQSTPKYCLLIVGASGEMKVWIVEDGKLLYVDKNANGDLTDDGPPIAPTNVRELGDGYYDFNYLVDAITSKTGSRCRDFNLRRWSYGGKDDSYGMSLSLERTRAKKRAPVAYEFKANDVAVPLTDELPMYAGWFGTFWSTKPETAPVIHFGGPLTPRMLREKEFVIGSGPRRLSMALMNPGSEPGAISRLSIDALPAHVIPRLTIKWPTDGKGAPLQTSHDLSSRCCYWEFYTTEFEVPDGVGVGIAEVTAEFPEFKLPLKLATTRIEVPVVERASKSNE